MKPPAFDYHAPASLDEVLALLAQTGEEAKLLAGGQSLVPLLNMRLLHPSVLIDLNRTDGMDGVTLLSTEELRLGAMVRTRTLERHPLIRDRFPLLAEAAAHIGHLQIRTRGTLGGSLAHADPAAELPAVAAAMDGRMLVGRSGTSPRSIPAGQFVVGPLTTALAPDEVLLEVRIPPLPPRTGHAFVELARRHGDFALVGAAALLHLDGDGRIDYARLALCGVGGRPYCPLWVDMSLRGEPPAADLFRAVGLRVRDEVDPDGDIHASVEYRRRVASVMTIRALELAAQRTGGSDGVNAHR